MRKFKTTIFGYQKRSVEELVEQMQTNHDQKKELLELDLQELTDKIDKLEKKLWSHREGG